MDNEAEILLRIQHEWKSGNRSMAWELAQEYVAANEKRLTELLGGLTREECVQMLSQYRDEGRVYDQTVIDCWIMVKFSKQHISGSVNIGVKPSEVVAAAEAVLRGES